MSITTQLESRRQKEHIVLRAYVKSLCRPSLNTAMAKLDRGGIEP
jgi:hypothetical protein